MNESNQQLLLSLKTIVEGLLSSQVANIWNIYGGLNRLHRVIDRIIKHEFTVFKQNGEEDCWVFIEKLGEKSPSGDGSQDPAAAWLHQCLESHSLSGKLSQLLSNEEHVHSCYRETAFLRQPLYVEAALTCLRAVELNQLSLLTDIHPSLYLSVRSVKPDEKLHRRCSSYPDSVKTVQARQEPMKALGRIDRTWSSVPCLADHAKVAYSTQPSTPVPARRPLSASVLKIDYSKSPAVDRQSSKRELSSGVSESPMLTSTKRSFLDGGPVVMPMSTGFFPKPSRGQSLASFLTSNQFSYTSAELDRENAHFSISEAIIAAIEQVKYDKWEKLMEEVIEESDEEICELKQRIRLRRSQRREEKRFGLLARQRRRMATDSGITGDIESGVSSSDCSSGSSPSTEGVDDMEVDQVTPNLANTSGLSLSMASLYSEADLVKSPNQITNHPLSEVNRECETTERSKSPEHLVKNRPKSEDKKKEGNDGAIDEKVLKKRSFVERREEETLVGSGCCGREEVRVTAEGVALSLLKKFSDKQLPRASDIDWLVSEKEAPQQLLPLPDSWSVGGDEMIEATALRGNSQWAPPRPQIIFTIHLPAPRRVLMEKQKYMCAGCGMRVAPEYAHKFRYCDYLGRYFCTGCHSNQAALIPARIICKWDFNKYPVSNFSYKLLDQMSGDPLFNIGDVNPVLYKKVRELNKVKNLRLQLFHLKDFLILCRFCSQIKEKLEKEPSYLLSDPEIYSVDDLTAVRSGQLTTRLSQLMVQGSNHVAKCQLCEGRGFVCELCRSQGIIYPWQLAKVTRCSKCGSCYHSACFKGSCPRCDRIQARLKSSSVVSAQPPSSEKVAMLSASAKVATLSANVASAVKTHGVC